MNIYKISQDINKDYDTFDSAIVAAANENDARNIHPFRSVTNPEKWDTYCELWVTKDQIHLLKVELIGKTIDENCPAGVILASYNAG